MNDQNYRSTRIWLIIAAIAVFLLLAFNFTFFLGYKSIPVLKSSDIKINKGVADFRSYTFHQNLKLKGEALFYWKKLLTPLDFKDSIPQYDTLAPVPGIWNQLKINGHKLGSFGYGTYYFKILVPDSGMYAITLRGFDCAYRIWINNEEASAGKVGISKKTMTPGWKRNTVYFNAPGGEARVVIQISNFYHRKGGAEDAMVFGKYKSIIYYKHIQLSVTMLLLGVLLIVFIYHILLFSHRQNDHSLILFSALSLAFSVRLICTGEKIIFEIFPNIHWYITIVLEYLSFVVALPLFLAFVYQLFPDEISKKVVKLVAILSAFFSLIILCTPVYIFTFTPVIFQILLILSAIYVLYGTLKAVIRKRSMSILFLVGLLIFILIITNDILFYNNKASNNFMLPLGILVLTFTQAVIISLKSSQAFKEVEQYKLALEESNRFLERKVKKRTQQIAEANQELEKQAHILKETNEQLQELSKFKDGMTGMIVHDLKNPLNLVLNFSKDERVLLAARQMLNLVHNILDVQRHEEKAMVLDRKPVPIKKLVSQALIQVGYLFSEKKIALDNCCHDNIVVEVDQNIMVRVLVNLLTNALKYTPFQGVIGIYSEMKGQQVKLAISDQGPGISEEKRQIVFQKFGQINKIDTGAIESTGIGLSFCKLAIEAHGGSIDFESETGKGSTFWFLLDATKESAQTVETHRKKTAKPAPASDLILTQQEIDLLNDQVQKLSDLKVFEVTKIKAILNALPASPSPGQTAWLSLLNHAVWSGNQSEYDRLIRVISTSEKDNE